MDKSTVTAILASILNPLAAYAASVRRLILFAAERLSVSDRSAAMLLV
jgi:hypothetical protein